MIDTNPLGPDEREVNVKREYEADEDESSFWVERATNLIYEVRLFPDFALLRPAHPDETSNLERMSLVTFASKFDEYFGDVQTIKDFMWGAEIDSIEITRIKKKK